MTSAALKRRAEPPSSWLRLEARLHVLLCHLAERMVRVRPDGVHLAVTHETLGHLWRPAGRRCRQPSARSPARACGIAMARAGFPGDSGSAFIDRGGRAFAC